MCTHCCAEWLLKTTLSLRCDLAAVNQLPVVVTHRMISPVVKYMSFKQRLPACLTVGERIDGKSITTLTSSHVIHL